MEIAEWRDVGLAMLGGASLVWAAFKYAVPFLQRRNSNGPRGGNNAELVAQAEWRGEFRALMGGQQQALTTIAADHRRIVELLEGSAHVLGRVLALTETVEERSRGFEKARRP